MTKLSILGTAQSMAAAPYDDKSWEIWACQPAISYPSCKRADRLFELHTEVYWKDPAIIKRINDANVPVMMQRVFPEIPKSERFPLGEMAENFAAMGYAGARYYHSTIAYMLAYALFVGGWEEISLDGVHMSAKEEYRRQLPAMTYWVGVANALGVKVRIPEDSAICKSRSMYGYDSESAIATQIRLLQAKNKQALAEARSRVDDAVQTMYKRAGVDEVLEHLFGELS